MASGAICAALEWWRVMGFCHVDFERPVDMFSLQLGMQVCSFRERPR